MEEENNNSSKFVDLFERLKGIRDYIYFAILAVFIYANVSLDTWDTWNGYFISFNDYFT